MNKEKLQVKTFTRSDTMLEWANSEDGTDYIISINYTAGLWCLFYIK